MNDRPENKTSPDEAILISLVQEAGDVLVTPKSTHVEKLRSEVFSRLAVAPRRWWRITRRRVLATGSLATAATLAMVIWLSQPTVGFTELTEAMREKPWIHVTIKSPDDASISGENWFSFARDVAAVKKGERVFFFDHRLGIKHEYDPKKKKLFRLAISDKDEFQSMSALFEAIFSGDDYRGDELLRFEIIDRSRRKIREQDRNWIEYEFLLRRGSANAANSSPLVKLVLRAEPESHLPVTMKMLLLEAKEQPGLSGFEYVFDYPDEGPVDIYALGVPRSIELVDQVPRGDLQRIIKATNSNLDNFDSYFAIITNETTYIANKSPRHAQGEKVQHVAIEHLIWRKGKKVRIEMCMKTRASVGKTADPPAPGEDMLAWWKRQLPFYTRIPHLISDGKTIYRMNIDKYQNDGNFDGEITWKSIGDFRSKKPLERQTKMDVNRGNFAEFHAFHRLYSSSRYPLTLDPNTNQGPPDTLLVSSANSEYWLDPTRSYAARQVKHTFPKARPHVYEMEEFRQTPNGIWIPTLVRWKNSSDLYDDGTFRGDQVKRFYHDFKAELPDDLFRPTDKLPDLTP